MGYGRGVIRQPSLIIQVASGGAVHEQLRRQPPPSVTVGDVLVEALPADSAGRPEFPAAGEVVLSVLAPEALLRDRDELHRVIDDAGTGTEPLVIVVQAAEELRDDELTAVLDAASPAHPAQMGSPSLVDVEGGCATRDADQLPPIGRVELVHCTASVGVDGANGDA
jgi:hypothetical protein